MPPSSAPKTETPPKKRALINRSVDFTLRFEFGALFKFLPLSEAQDGTRGAVARRDANSPVP